MARKVIVRGKGRRKLLNGLYEGQKFMFANGTAMYRLLYKSGSHIEVKHLTSGKIFRISGAKRNAKVMIYNG